jgi:SpoVK/Ycf46/Vps4 family AAA+-type ATPase
MASGKLLRQLIKSGAEGDLACFRSASQAVIDEERAKKHHLLANDLEKILYSHTEDNRRFQANLPEDRERGLPLVVAKNPARRIEDLVLSDDNSSVLEEILQEHHRDELLRSYGLRAADKLLFCGPPGCGKTLTAEVIASEL